MSKVFASVFSIYFFCFYILVQGNHCKFNKNLILERHNDLRSKHNANPLNWSEELERVAKREAQLIEKKFDCHITGKLENTNYFTFSKHSEIESAVNSWYEGISNYDFELGVIQKNDNVFEFTQLIWKSVEHIGCATSCCKNSGVLICKYDSFANTPGHFADNVGTIDEKFVTGNIKIGITNESTEEEL